jgi:hypothetical protein
MLFLYIANIDGEAPLVANIGTSQDIISFENRTLCAGVQKKTRAWFRSQNFSRKTTVTNLAAHALSIKYRRNKKLIAQFVCKLRDERFEPN